MSKEDKNTFNFLCAIFLDYELISPCMRKNPSNWTHSYWEHKDRNNGTVRVADKVLCADGCLPFASDWNALMRVIYKIQSLPLDDMLYNIIIYRKSIIPTPISTFYIYILDQSGCLKFILRPINSN